MALAMRSTPRLVGGESLAFAACGVRRREQRRRRRRPHGAAPARGASKKAATAAPAREPCSGTAAPHDRRGRQRVRNAASPRWPRAGPACRWPCLAKALRVRGSVEWY
ncbi:unnamed protein product [Prorocentrum cordatum]|uniref:Uncharacterized protein n=1 Tax=Prorocentrum cordatum TaxID=2364126 RepID=A0ABN9TYQ5_9DINO|nr:unnamed protein product [Polarella glacialis]